MYIEKYFKGNQSEVLTYTKFNTSFSFTDFSSFLQSICINELKFKNIRRIENDKFNLSFHVNDSKIIESILPANQITANIFEILNSSQILTKLNSDIFFIKSKILKNFEKRSAKFVFKDKINKPKNISYYELTCNVIDPIKIRYYLNKKDIPKSFEENLFILNSLKDNQLIHFYLNKRLDKNIRF